MSEITKPVVLDETGKALVSAFRSAAAALWAEKNPEVPAGDVNFIDYDATIVYAYTRAEFLGMASMPANPAHAGLVAQGWNWDLQAAQAYVAAYGGCEIGQSYITEDGKTRLYIDIAQTERLGITLRWTQDTVSGVSVDWGDGSAAEAVADTGACTLTHTYAAAGRYLVTLTVADGCEAMLGTSTDAALQDGAQYDDSAFIGTIYGTGRDPLLALEIGSGVTAIGCCALRVATSLKTVTIPQGVTGLYASAFEGCYDLRAIALPTGLASIGAGAFHCAYALRAAALPQGLTSIGESCFATCVALERLAIPESVAAIPAGAFQRCFGAERIIVPDGVQAIGAHAFESCYRLRAVRVPEGVTALSDYALSRCYSLTGVTLPATLTTIGEHALSYCFAIGQLTIPAGVTEIGAFACAVMDGCDAIHLLPTVPPALVSPTAFDTLGEGCAIRVPYSVDHSVLAAYLAATNWSVLDLVEEVG